VLWTELLCLHAMTLRDGKCQKIYSILAGRFVQPAIKGPVLKYMNKI